jgi:hypothetical protein
MPPNHIRLSRSKAKRIHRKSAQDTELEGLDHHAASPQTLAELKTSQGGQLSPGTVLQLQRMIGNAAVQRMLSTRQQQPTATRQPIAAKTTGKQPIHRMLVVSDDQIKSFTTAKTKIQNSGFKPKGGWTQAHWDRLKLWVKRKDVYSSVQWYMTGQSWTFIDWAEAAQGLDAHVQSRANRAKEKTMAKDTTKSKTIQTNLVSALTTIGGWVDGINNLVMSKVTGKITIKSYSGKAQEYTDLWDYLEKFKGQYNHWYPNGKIKSSLTAPSKSQMTTNFVILRELFYALDSAKKSVTDLPNLRPNRLMEGTGTHGRVDVDPTSGETRRDDMTPEMRHNWVQNAIQMKMPLGAGASGTIDRLLNLASIAGVDPQGMEAIAWAGFAFWNSTYSKIQGYGHTFHEVMDVAKVNYGINYEAGEYPTKIPPD